MGDAASGPYEATTDSRWWPRSATECRFDAGTKTYPGKSYINRASGYINQTSVECLKLEVSVEVGWEMPLQGHS